MFSLLLLLSFLSTKEHKFVTPNKLVLASKKSSSLKSVPVLSVRSPVDVVTSSQSISTEKKRYVIKFDRKKSNCQTKMEFIGSGQINWNQVKSRKIKNRLSDIDALREGTPTESINSNLFISNTNFIWVDTELYCFQYFAKIQAKN